MTSRTVKRCSISAQIPEISVTNSDEMPAWLLPKAILNETLQRGINKDYTGLVLLARCCILPFAGSTYSHAKGLHDAGNANPRHNTRTGDAWRAQGMGARAQTASTRAQRQPNAVLHGQAAGATCGARSAATGAGVQAVSGGGVDAHATLRGAVDDTYLPTSGKTARLDGPGAVGHTRRRRSADRGCRRWEPRLPSRDDCGRDDALICVHPPERVLLRHLKLACEQAAASVETRASSLFLLLSIGDRRDHAGSRTRRRSRSCSCHHTHPAGYHLALTSSLAPVEAWERGSHSVDISIPRSAFRFPSCDVDLWILLSNSIDEACNARPCVVGVRVGSPLGWGKWLRTQPRVNVCATPCIYPGLLHTMPATARAHGAGHALKAGIYHGRTQAQYTQRPGYACAACGPHSRTAAGYTVPKHGRAGCCRAPIYPAYPGNPGARCAAQHQPGRRPWAQVRWLYPAQLGAGVQRSAGPAHPHQGNGAGRQGQQQQGQGQQGKPRQGGGVAFTPQGVANTGHPAPFTKHKAGKHGAHVQHMQGNKQGAATNGTRARKRAAKRATGAAAARVARGKCHCGAANAGALCGAAGATGKCGGAGAGRGAWRVAWRGKHTGGARGACTGSQHGGAGAANAGATGAQCGPNSRRSRWAATGAGARHGTRAGATRHGRGVNGTRAICIRGAARAVGCAVVLQTMARAQAARMARPLLARVNVGGNALRLARARRVGHAWGKCGAGGRGVCDARTQIAGFALNFEIPLFGFPKKLKKEGLERKQCPSR